MEQKKKYRGFKPLKGFEKYYLINKQGHLVRLERTIKENGKVVSTVKEKIIIGLIKAKLFGAKKEMAIKHYVDLTFNTKKNEKELLTAE